MPLFGPNIKRMKEVRDVSGLIQLLTHKDAKVRVEATKALSELRAINSLAQVVSRGDDPKVRVAVAHILKDIGDREAFEALANALSTTIRLAEWEDQVEAMIIIQGRVPTSLVETAFLTERQEALKNVYGPLELRHFQGLLDEVIKEGKDPFSKWFALLTLAELGDRRDEILQSLIDFSDSLAKGVDTSLAAQAGQRNFALYVVANITNCLIEETVRAFASFKGNAVAVNAVVKVLDGDLLVGSYVHEGYSDPYLHPRHQENAICALSALGDSSTRERLEYLAARGSESIRKVARVALELYGKATYDEIKNKAESS